jgi:hypothetical protein
MHATLPPSSSSVSVASCADEDVVKTRLFEGDDPSSNLTDEEQLMLEMGLPSNFNTSKK